MTNTARIYQDLNQPKDYATQLLSPDDLIPHPENPRGKEESLAELVASIERYGQIQPAIVRPAEGGKYEVLVGWRRSLACRRLGRLVSCYVVEGLTDDQALAILLNDNQVRQDPDPLLESEAVAAFLARPGWTVKTVAEALGKSIRWVAQRANLRNLGPEIRKVGATWPVSVLEELAKLPKNSQKQFVEENRWNIEHGDLSSKGIERYMAEAFHQLGKATWKLDDATLVPKAGACTNCPKTSLRTPGLFDDDLENKDVNKAQCKDSACWELKTKAQQVRAIEAFRAENKKGIVIKGDYNTEVPKGVIAVHEYQVKKAKKKDPKAVPALVVGGENDGKTLHVVQDPQYSNDETSKKLAKASKEKEEVTPAKKLKASKERIAARRKAFLVDAVRELIADLKSAPADVVQGLVTCFEVKEMLGPRDCYVIGSAPKERRKAYEAQSPETWSTQVWDRMRGNVVSALRRYSPERLKDDHALALWLAELLKIDAEGIQAQAVEEIPDPKWWPKP